MDYRFDFVLAAGACRTYSLSASLDIPVTVPIDRHNREWDLLVAA
jgi:hypothetical protein